MKKNKKENYLEKIPCRNEAFNWTKAEDGKVTLEIENKGIVKRITQKLLKKPKFTYIDLDEMGSFIWPLIDGESNLIVLGERVKENFGDKAEPLYERLAQYFVILEKYKFIIFKK